MADDKAILGDKMPTQTICKLFPGLGVRHSEGSDGHLHPNCRYRHGGSELPTFYCEGLLSDIQLKEPVGVPAA